MASLQQLYKLGHDVLVLIQDSNFQWMKEQLIHVSYYLVLSLFKENITKFSHFIPLQWEEMNDG